MKLNKKKVKQILKITLIITYQMIIKMKKKPKKNFINKRKFQCKAKIISFVMKIVKFRIKL